MAHFYANFFTISFNWLQLQVTNNDLKTWMLDALGDVANVASKAASAVALTILTNKQAPVGGQSMWNAKVADPETFDGS